MKKNIFLICCVILLIVSLSVIAQAHVKGTSCYQFSLPFSIYSESRSATNIVAERSDVIYFCGDEK